MTRLKFHKYFDFTPCAAISYLSQISSFKMRHTRDRYQDFNIEKTIPGYREHVLIFNEAKG